MPLLRFVLAVAALSLFAGCGASTTPTLPDNIAPAPSEGPKKQSTNAPKLNKKSFEDALKKRKSGGS